MLQQERPTALGTLFDFNWSSLLMTTNEEGSYIVTHPLNDVHQEEKIQPLAPMKHNLSMLLVLITLRLYMLSMLAIVILAVLRLAHVF